MRLTPQVFPPDTRKSCSPRQFLEAILGLRFPGSAVSDEHPQSDPRCGSPMALVGRENYRRSQVWRVKFRRRRILFRLKPESLGTSVLELHRSDCRLHRAASPDGSGTGLPFCGLGRLSRSPWTSKRAALLRIWVILVGLVGTSLMLQKIVV